MWSTRRSCGLPARRSERAAGAMPRIDADLKLDFKDVLLRPKRSSLKSRAEVDLERTFTFRNSKQTYSGIPIIVANMDTVGTFEMAVVMSQHSMLTAIHKHYTLDDWKLFVTNHPECLQHIAVSSGSGKNDLEKMSSILEAVPQVKFICLDVANGYSEHFVEFVKLVRARFPEHTIMLSWSDKVLSPVEALPALCLFPRGGRPSVFLTGVGHGQLNVPP
ncbi:GMP reductase 1, partial [Eschrichtius robustus]|nr:GMP reductase 1 [Eschrichtius robustus]